jgi:glycopeptide antibiotics resistance protein
MCVLKIRRAAVALVLFVAFLAGLVYLADTGHLHRLYVLAQWIPWGDKLGHLVLFGILSFLVNLLFHASKARLGPFTVLKGSALVAVVVTLEECSQLLFPSRTFDLGDLAADFIGIWLAGRLALLHLASLAQALKQPAPIPAPRERTPENHRALRP